MTDQDKEWDKETPKTSESDNSHTSTIHLNSLSVKVLVSISPEKSHETLWFEV